MFSSEQQVTDRTTQFLSLREIGRRLNIPPSSVVYYKDRFERFIPHAGGGKRKRYPAEALPIFKEIRAMFEKNWSAEQIEQTLHHFQAGPTTAMPGMSPGPGDAGPEFAHSISGVLEKVSSLLENQSLFRAEIESLRKEVSVLMQEKQDLDTQYQETVARLEQQIGDLEREKGDLLRRILDRLDMDESGARAKHGKRADQPPASFLELPLVILTEQGEYLGVAGKTRHFSLREFHHIISASADADKTLDMSWRRAGDAWVLRVSTHKASTGERHEHELEAAETLTPSGNRVIRLQRLVIDGTTVPDPFLLMLFRKIKDGFDD